MNFIEQVTYDLISRGWDNLRNMTIVFPMHRAALFMKEEFKRQMLRQHLDKPVLAPRFTTLSELTDELCAPYLRPDDEIHSVCLLHEIFCEQTHAEIGLDTFYGWGKQLLTDFSNADMSEADASLLFENSADAHELEVTYLSPETRQRLLDLMQGQSEHSEDDDSLHKQIQTLWRLLGSVYAEFGRRQREQGVAYSGARLKYVVEHFDQLAPALADRTFVFVGFNYLLAKERQLMEKLAPRALFYWDHRDNFHTNPDAYKYTGEGILHFGQALSAQDETSSPKTIDVISTATLSAQAQYVHRWLAERANLGGRVGIVIADETMLEPVIYALPGEVSGRVNITKGFPLRNTKVYADILAYLSDKRNDCREGETCAHVLRRLMATVVKAIDEERQPDIKNWQQALIQESYYQAQVVLNRFCALIDDGTLRGIRLMTLRNILRRHLEMVLLPFHGDPVTDIQIIGVLETRLLDFDHLLVLNVEEGTLPKTQADNSFIPFYLRKYYHMPTGSESAEVYAHNFFRLLHRTDDATILFCNATDGNNRKTMSRFLMQILTSPEFIVRKHTLVESSLLPAEPFRLLREPARTRYPERLSPSAIKTYLKCPMSYYLQYVQGISSTQESGIIMQSNEIGTLVHSAIHAIYTRILGPLPAVVNEAVTKQLLDDQLIEDALLEGYRALNEEYRRKHSCEGDFFLPGEHKAETLVARSHVRNVLENDISTASTQGLTIVAMEQPYYCTLQIPDAGTLRVGGYIDRLDIVGGRLRVLDFKSGSPLSAFPDTLEDLFTDGTKHGNMLQTLIYCLACADPGNRSLLNPQDLPVMPALLYSARKNYDPTLRLAGMPLLDFTPDMQTRFRELLVSKVHEIFTATSFPQLDDIRYCHLYCPFAILCNR